MCNFFSCNSDGQGNVIYFKVEDIAKIMSEGNKDGLDFNSHTSIASYFNHPPVYEDKWNKWEYDVEKKVLKVDSLVVKDDRRRVKKIIENYLKDKDFVFIRNLYGRNSGYRNSGNYNSGDYNSGDYNSGDYNSGYRNSGDGFLNSFCSERQYYLFNQKCSQTEYEKINELRLYEYLTLQEWVCEADMTSKEKKSNLTYKTCGGYLKHTSLEECWKKVPKKVLKEIKKLKNFDAKVFKEVCGLKI